MTTKSWNCRTPTKIGLPPSYTSICHKSNKTVNQENKYTNKETRHISFNIDEKYFDK